MIFILRDEASGRYLAVDAFRGWHLTSDLVFAMRVRADGPNDPKLRYGMDAATERLGGKTRVHLEARPAPEVKLQ